MRYVVLASLVALCGCGNFGRTVAQLTGYHESCVDGVVYLQFASGVTAKLRPDGLPVTCQ